MASPSYPSFLQAPAEKEAPIDIEVPLATLLREGTKVAHVVAESSTGVRALLEGKVPLDGYIEFLSQLWWIYSTLESRLSQTDIHEASHFLTQPPHPFFRVKSLTDDIEYLTQLSNSRPNTTTNTTVSTSITTPPPISSTLSEYVKYLQQLEEHKLIAHAYVRYMGDMSGGSVFGKRVGRIYNLPPRAKGREFYWFGREDEDVSGSMTPLTPETVEKAIGFNDEKLVEVREEEDFLLEEREEEARIRGELKSWFRDEMNRLEINDDVKRDIVGEASVAFICTAVIMDTTLVASLDFPSAKAEPKSGSTAPVTSRTSLFQSLQANPVVPAGLVLVVGALAIAYFRFTR